MHFGAEDFVLLGFVLFVALMIWLGVHKLLAGMLDARIDRVKNELAEAERLRQEAALVLEDYKRKAVEAEKDAAAIIAQAKTEAELLAKETEQRMAEFVSRRTRQAEQKIAQAEAQAAADVRSAAADAAVRAAEQVMRQDLKGETANELLGRSIAEMRQRLN